ncbi:uncharacterized protein LOC121413253 [Lytechinus variegatus]|uniref:uncharacterized protein LOC121413253 n=1 Tax=Lytechinus variegatus TaxID=7654 RepID=UPI001BB173E9|nr:uncharacterized protein LOC121413253 [Lytechinus variegatus]
MEEKLELVRKEYGSTLSDLKINSKPHINALTTLADEYIPYASEVVRLIESRLQKAPSNEKLPILYLMDSIVKNVKKGPYQQLFARNLTNNFCGVFAKVNEKTRASLFKLRSTWNQYFASGILHALDVRVQKIDPAWPIMAASSAPAAPAPSIHINPKFIKKPAPMESTATPTAVQATPTVVTSELSDKDRLEQEMRQSLISKQQELLQIQQQRLELELEQTKARLESQARELAAKNQALAEQQAQMSKMAVTGQAPTAPPSVVPTPAVPATPVITPLLQQTVTAPTPASLVGGMGLLGEAPAALKPPLGPQGLLGAAPPLTSIAPGVHSTTQAPTPLMPTISQASQAPATVSNLPNTGLVQSQASRNTINPRDPRLARDPRLRQAFEQQQQQRQQQEQLLLLQQKKHLLQQEEIANLANQTSASMGLDTGVSAAASKLMSGAPPNSASAKGTQPTVSDVASSAASVTPAPPASVKETPTNAPADFSKKVSKGSSPSKKSVAKGKTAMKPGVKLDHLDLSGKSKTKEETKTKEESKTGKNSKEDVGRKGKSEGDKAAERDTAKRGLRSSSRNYRKTTNSDKEERMRSESHRSRTRSASGSPSHSDSHSRSRSRSRSPRSGPSSPRSGDRRERDRRGGKSSDSKRKDSKENKPENKEKRKSPSPDRSTDEDKFPSKKYSKQDQLPPKKRARLIEKEQQEAERQRERERSSRAVRSRGERERAAGWMRTENRDYAPSLRPPRRPSLSNRDIQIPKELSMSRLAKVLEQAEKQLNSGALTHEQHQQLLRELNEIYNIQRQKREEEERHNRRPPPPEWGPRDQRDPRNPRDPRDLHDPRDPRMMRDPRAQRGPMPYHGPRPREEFDHRDPPDVHDAPPYKDSRPPLQRREFSDRDPRIMQNPKVPAQEDPRHRSLLEDPRMRKFSSNPDIDEGSRKLPPQLQDPRSRIMKAGTEEDVPQSSVNPGMDVDERKRTFRQYRGPLDEKLPLPVSPKDTDERDLKQFAEMGDVDLRKPPPGHDGQSKMDVDYRVLPAAFQDNVKENVEGIGDTDERQRVKAGDSDERKIDDDAQTEKSLEEPSKQMEVVEDKLSTQENAPSEVIKKDTKDVTKLPRRSSAKAEWEAAAVRVKPEGDVDMRQKPVIKKTNKQAGKDEEPNPANDVKPAKDDEQEKTSELTGLTEDKVKDKDDRRKEETPTDSLLTTTSGDTDERKFPAQSEIKENINADNKIDEMGLPSDDMELPSVDVDLRQPMPVQVENIPPLMDFEPEPGMAFHDKERAMDDDFQQQPFMGPGPPRSRRGRGGRAGKSNKWQTWKKEHPDEASAPHFDDGPDGFDPNDPRRPPMHHPRFRRGMHPRGPFEDDVPPFDRRHPRFRDAPPMMDEEPPMEPWGHMDRDDHFRFREGDGPRPFEQQDFMDDRRRPMEEREFPPDEDGRDPGHMRDVPVNHPRDQEGFENHPLDVIPADTPRSPEPENRYPPNYCLGPDKRRNTDKRPVPHDDREPHAQFPREKLPFKVEGPPMRGPRPEGVLPRGAEGFNPRNGPAFRGPRPDMPRPMGPDGPRLMGPDRPRSMGPDGPRPIGPDGPRPIGPDGPRFMHGPRGPSDMPRFGSQGMGPRMHPDGPMRGPGNQFQPRSNSPPVSSDMQRPPMSGPAVSLPGSVLSNIGNLGNFQQLVQSVSQQVLNNMRNQQQTPGQIPAQSLIRSALQTMGVRGNVPNNLVQAAQNNLLDQMKSMPNVMRMRMMRPQQMERAPMPEGSLPPQRMPYARMQARPSMSMAGMPPNSMAPGMQQGAQGIGSAPNSDQQGVPIQGIPPRGMPMQGMSQQGMQPGMPLQGVRPGMAPQGVRPGMPPQGVLQQGVRPGMPQQGMLPQGVRPGLPPQGTPSQGMPPQGIPQQGMPMQEVRPGMPPQGIPSQEMSQGMHPGMMPGSQGPIRMQQGGPGGPGFLPQGMPGDGMVRQPQPAAPVLDITSLFSKLVSSGILKEPLKPASPAPDQTATPAAAPVEKAKEDEAVAEKDDEDSQDVEDDGIFDIPEISLKTDELKVRHPGIIKRMSSGMQCTSCGQRFVIAQMDRYRKHLDWHFRQNRKKQDGNKATTSRKWYYEVDEWLDYEEINDMEDARSTFFEEQAQEFADRERGPSSVPVTTDSSDEFCKICRESFEQFFNEETEEWHFRDAIRVDGKTFHPSCYDDAKDSSAFLDASTDDLLSPPLVRTRNSFSGTPVSPGASGASSNPLLVAPGKVSWDAVLKTDGKAASKAGAAIKAEPKTEANPEVNPVEEGKSGEEASKASDLVKIKVEPEEPMESIPSVEEASDNSGTEVKIEPSSRTIKSEPGVEEAKTTLPVKQETGVDSAVSQTLVEKEQLRKEEVKTSLADPRGKSSPLPFLEEITPEPMETESAVPETVPAVPDAVPAVPDIVPTAAMDSPKTDAVPVATDSPITAMPIQVVLTTRTEYAEGPRVIPSDHVMPTEEPADIATEAVAITPSGSGDAAVASDPPVQPPADDGHAPKKLPLSEAVATLRGSEESADPPVLEVEAPLSSTGQGQTEDTAQSSQGIFEKLTPPPALKSMESEESEPNATGEPPAESSAGGGDTNQNAGENQESST